MKIRIISSLATFGLMVILQAHPVQAEQDKVRSAIGLICKTQAALESILESGNVKDGTVDPELVADANKKFGDTCDYVKVFYEKRDKVKEIPDGLAVLDVVKLSITGRCIGRICILFTGSEDGYVAFAHKAETAT